MSALPHPSRTPLKSDEIMYLRCFVKAHKEGQFTIDCTSVQEAHRIKIALYRAKKKLTSRPDLQGEYPEFLDACQDTSIALKANPDRLVLYRTDASDFNQRLMAQLGMTREDTKSQLDREIEESEKRLRRMLEGSGDLGEPIAAATAAPAPAPAPAPVPTPATAPATAPAPAFHNPYVDVIADQKPRPLSELMYKTLTIEKEASERDEAERRAAGEGGKADAIV